MASPRFEFCSLDRLDPLYVNIQDTDSTWTTCTSISRIKIRPEQLVCQYLGYRCSLVNMYDNILDTDSAWTICTSISRIQIRPGQLYVNIQDTDSAWTICKSISRIQIRLGQLIRLFPGYRCGLDNNKIL